MNPLDLRRYVRTQRPAGIIADPPEPDLHYTSARTNGVRRGCGWPLSVRRFLPRFQVRQACRLQLRPEPPRIGPCRLRGTTGYLTVSRAPTRERTDAPSPGRNTRTKSRLAQVRFRVRRHLSDHSPYVSSDTAHCLYRQPGSSRVLSTKETKHEARPRGGHPPRQPAPGA